MLASTDEMWKKEFISYYDNANKIIHTYLQAYSQSKTKVDSGVAPHDVICRNGLFLVERFNKYRVHP